MPQTPADGEAPALDRVHLHMPVDVRSVSLALLATIAVVFALHAASAVFVPLLLCAGLLLGLGGGLGWMAYALSDDAATLVASLPEATQKVHDAVRSQRGQAESTFDKVQRAATQLEQAAREGSAAAPAGSRGVTRVSIERSRFDIKDYLWSGTVGFAASIGQAAVVAFIAFFLMASGNSFRRKLVRIAGPSFAQRRITVQVLDEITGQIHRYLLVQVFTSVLVGLSTGLAFWALGLEHAAVRGVWGLLLGVPILTTMKAVCDRVDDLKPIGELLGA